MKTRLILMLTLLMTNFLSAQNLDTVHLWPANVPGEINPKHAHIVGTGKKNNSMIFTEITDPTYIVYTPQATKSNGCGIVVCSGGGYGQIATMEDVAAWLNSLGFTAFTLQYRVPGKREGALMDIQRAMRIIRSKSEYYKINPNKLGVIGLSAGGNLCAKACTRFKQDAYTKIDDVDTISTRPDYALLLYPAYLDKGENNTLSAGLPLNNDLPPLFICVAKNDKNHYNSSIVFTEALKNAKIPFEFHEFETGGHGFIFQKGNEAAAAWPDLAKTWLINEIK